MAFEKRGIIDYIGLKAETLMVRRQFNTNKTNIEDAIEAFREATKMLMNDDYGIIFLHIYGDACSLRKNDGSEVIVYQHGLKVGSPQYFMNININS
jgi:hypothetical protein